MSCSVLLFLQSTHPELPPEHDDFPPGLLLPEPPLHQVLAVLSWQRHVASGYSWVSSTFKWIRERHKYHQYLKMKSKNMQSKKKAVHQYVHESCV